MCLLALIFLKSVISWGAWVKAFLLVGGGVKGALTKLKGGVIC